MVWGYCRHRDGCACRETGFFYIVGHGVDEALQARLETLSREFFLKPIEEKWRIHAFEGTYRDYLLRKVSKLFPALRLNVLDAP